MHAAQAGQELAAKLDEKEKAITVLSGALRNRDTAVANLTQRLAELKDRYAELESQYTSTNPTMPSLAALPDKSAGGD